MTVDLTALAPWVAILLAATSLGYSIYTNRSKDIEQRFGTIQKQLDDKAAKETATVTAGKLDSVEDRVTRLESDLRHLPDHSTVNRLESMIGKLSGEVGVLSERIRPVAAIAERLQEKILEGVDR